MAAMKELNSSTSPHHLSDCKESNQDLRKKGLHLSVGLSQVGGSLDFEVPARLSRAVSIGRCSIGAFSYVGQGSEIRNTSIGRFCSIAANVALGPAEHPTNWLSSHPFQFDGVRYFDEYPHWQAFASSIKKFGGNASTTHIGHDVWIGRNAIVRQGVKVGDGAVIAAGSFVNQDVPDFSIVGGVPARVIRCRFDDETITRLQALQWWNYELSSQKNEIDFSRIEYAISQIENLIYQNKLAAFNMMRRRIEKNDTGYILVDYI